MKTTKQRLSRIRELATDGLGTTARETLTLLDDVDRCAELENEVERLTKGIHTMRWGITDWMAHISTCERLLNGKSVDLHDHDGCMWCSEWPEEWKP